MSNVWKQWFCQWARLCRLGLLGLCLTLNAWAAVAATTSTTPPATSQGCVSALQWSVPRLQDEKPQNLCQYAGKVVLVVNTASYCGFTPQYKDLEALYEQYKGQGLVVLGFPSNDFSQEPDAEGKIADFCENTYGVKFPMFTKTQVKGPQAFGLFKWLAQTTHRAPAWNFYKYLISRDGEQVLSFTSMTRVQDPEFAQALHAMLGAK